MGKNDSQQTRRRWLHSLGLCAKCKSRDAYTMAGHWLCAECSAAENARRRADRKAHPDKYRKRWKKYRDAAIAAGLCGSCGKRPAETGCLLCRVCRASQRRRDAARYAAVHEVPPGPRGSDGRCYICNRAQAEPGKRTCARCAELMGRNLHGGKFKQKEAHPWKKDNAIVFGNTGKFLPRPGSST